jgi:hypothetical protein
MKRNYLKIGLLSIGFGLLLLGSCKEEAYEIPKAKDGLQNDIIKRSLGPNVVGATIDFAYAAAILPDQGKLTSIAVEASIAGDVGTVLENKSYYTSSTGADVGVVGGDPATVNGNNMEVKFTKDTSASTLRYSYKIPAEAKGKSVTFTFRARSSNGQEIALKTEAYAIRNMDMALDLIGKDGAACFFSVADLKWYTAAEAAANPDKIDLIYLYRALPTVTYAHSLVAPTADASYLPSFSLPVGLANKTKVVKAWTVRDQQLARLQYSVFVDDVDLKDKSFIDAPDFAINLKAESGIWLQTADGKYNAYVFINSVNNTTKEMKISVKRLQVK